MTHLCYSDQLQVRYHRIHWVDVIIFQGESQRDEVMLPITVLVRLIILKGLDTVKVLLPLMKETLVSNLRALSRRQSPWILDETILDCTRKHLKTFPIQSTKRLLTSQLKPGICKEREWLASISVSIKSRGISVTYLEYRAICYTLLMINMIS